MNEKKRGNLSLLSKYRGEVFGLSIISIVLFHFLNDVRRASLGGLRGDIANVYKFFIGSKGVDVFVFLSAVGLCYSMKKDRRILHFYAKRVKRLMIPYVIAGSVYWPLRYIFAAHKSIFTMSFLKDWTLLSFWTKGTRSVWFVTFIMVMYIGYPILFHIFDDYRAKKRPGGLICFLIVGAMTAAFFFLKGWAPNRYAYLEICLWRAPLFVMGAYIGERTYQGESMDAWDCVVLFGAFDLLLLRALTKYKILPITVNGVAFTKLTNGFWFTCFAALAILYVMVLVVHIIRWEPFRRFLRLAGAYSLELYLTHVMLRYLFVKIFHLKAYRLSVWLGYLGLAIVLCWPIHKLTEWLCGKLDGKKAEG